ncbi:MAG: T9SS type A sorting domain-containing protein, partial [Ignavibacteria bacterium]|nr:T9SS type A sorting domain-containing protein [Ignavibacteria bacterium]
MATTVKQVSHEIPNGFRLDQNYSNPFNPSTTIQFSLPQAGHAEIKVFTILGKELATLVSEYLPQGTHAAEWNAVGVASGVYFYRLSVAPTAPQHTRSDKAGDPSSRTAGSGHGFVQTKKL